MMFYNILKKVENINTQVHINLMFSILYLYYKYSNKYKILYDYAL